MPGMMKKGMMYQEGGPVRASGKRRGMDGGQKGVPVMTQEQRRQARSMMTEEERREADAPLTARELEGMSSRYKKGGMVKKAAGGMVTHMGPGSGNAPPAAGFPRMDRRPSPGQPSGRPGATPPANIGRQMPGRGPGPDFGAAAGPRGSRQMPMSRRMKKGGVVKKAKGGMIGRGCK